MISLEAKNKIEDSFRKIMIENRVKYASARYYTYQLHYFQGVLMTLDAIGEFDEAPPMWSVSLTSNREIIEPYTL